jgi:hypothetical protein
MITYQPGVPFVGVENVQGRFLYDFAPVHETEYPYRVCEKALFLHVLPSKALVIGTWKAGDKDIIKHLLSALRGRVIEAIPQAA